MRASYMSINRVDVQQTVKEVARFLVEPNEGAWIMDQAQSSGSIPRGSRQARASDLRTKVRQGTARGQRQRLRGIVYLRGKARRVLIFSMVST